MPLKVIIWQNLVLYAVGPLGQIGLGTTKTLALLAAKDDLTNSLGIKRLQFGSTLA